VSIPSTSMPICPTVDAGEYQVSSSGLRQLHADVCNGLDQIIQDTDGKVRAVPAA
jgi:hypothetical protein